MVLRIARRFRHESPVIHHARYAHVLPDMQQEAAATLRRYCTEVREQTVSKSRGTRDCV